MKIFIVEDEINLQEELKILLNKRNDIIVVGACTSVRQAVTILPAIEVDLVLMDIQLDDGQSFEILDQLNQINFDIIFVTAYNDYAIKAIKIGAIDYILKPIDEAELNFALDKVKKRNTKRVFKEQKDLVLKHTNEVEEVNKIVVKTTDAIYFIDVGLIYYCKGEGNYTTFFLKDREELLSSKPLKDYYNILPKSIFIQTHQSYVINKSYVKQFNNTFDIIMSNGTSIPVSKRRKESVLKKLSI